MNDQSTDDTERELKEAIDEIKACWQKGEYLDMPEPIERACMLVNNLNEQEEDGGSEVDREACLRGHVLVQDLYPRDDLHYRAIDDASADLDYFDVPKDEAEIRWAMVEDGVLHYKIEHENIPPIEYGRSVDTGAGQSGGGDQS